MNIEVINWNKIKYVTICTNGNYGFHAYNNRCIGGGRIGEYERPEGYVKAINRRYGAGRAILVVVD